MELKDKSKEMIKLIVSKLFTLAPTLADLEVGNKIGKSGMVGKDFKHV